MIQASEPLISQLAHDLAPELKDHAGVLAEFGAVLVPQREELLDAWVQADGETGFSREWYELAFVVLIEALQMASASSFQPYLEGVAAWSSQAATSGMHYTQAISQFTQLRRISLPIILTHYQPGPDLQLLFQALNTLERVVRTLVGGAFVQSGQVQLVDTARLRIIGHLTHGIAHSLNNLLTNILGRAQVLESKVTDEALRSEARAIQAAALIAADSLHRVQEYAAPREETEFIPTDLNAVVNDAVQLTHYRWRDDAEANGIVIDVIKDLSDVPPVLGKHGQLRDALVELILNAVEAMPAGGLISLRTERVGERVRLSVTDMGQGMDEMSLVRARTPFYTTRGGGHVGLGLATVQEVIQAHDSQLEITSTPGHGTTVMIALPIAEGELAQELALGEAPTRAVSILVVDDDAAIREIAAKALAIHGHRTLTAESGPEALTLFREQGPFQVVLCDLGMPAMNGLQVAQTIKASRPETVFLLMTGWGAEIDERKVRSVGVDNVIRKPFDIDQVLQTMGQALSAREH